MLSIFFRQTVITFTAQGMCKSEQQAAEMNLILEQTRLTRLFPGYYDIYVAKNVFRNILFFPLFFLKLKKKVFLPKSFTMAPVLDV